MNTTFNKILLSENKVLIEAAFEHEKAKMQTLSKLPALLKPFGLEAGEAKQLSWLALESKIKDTFLFPNATEEHNLNCMGLAKEFHDLKEYYRLSTWAFDAKNLSEEDNEAIREKYRIYTSNDTQNSIHALVDTVVNSLNKLTEMGVIINADQLYNVNRIFEGDNRLTPSVRTNQKYLSDTLIRLK